MERSIDSENETSILITKLGILVTIISWKQSFEPELFKQVENVALILENNLQFWKQSFEFKLEQRFGNQASIPKTRL